MAKVLSRELHPIKKMANEEVRTQTMHNIIKVKKSSCKRNDKATGIHAARILTMTTLKYTFVRYFLLDKPIMPLSIYRRAAKQH